MEKIELDLDKEELQEMIVFFKKRRKVMDTTISKLEQELEELPTEEEESAGDYVDPRDYVDGNDLL